MHVEGRVRVVRQRGLQRESGWLRAADLVEGTALVSTRFAAPVTLVIVALDDPAGTTAPGAASRSALEGAERANRRRRRAGGADRRRPRPARHAAYPIVAPAQDGVTVSVASEDGWHLVGVMAALPGADIDGGEQLAQTSLDLLSAARSRLGTRTGDARMAAGAAPRSRDQRRSTAERRAALPPRSASAAKARRARARTPSE